MPTVAPWPWNLHYYGKNDQVKDPESSFLPDSKPKKYHKKFSRLVIPITFLFNLPLWSVQKADRFWRIAMGYHKHSQALALQQLTYQIQYLFWSTSSPWTPDIKSPIWLPVRKEHMKSFAFISQGQKSTFTFLSMGCNKQLSSQP